MKENKALNNSSLREWLNPARRSALLVSLATLIVLVLAGQLVLNVTPASGLSHSLLNNTGLVYGISLVAALLLAALLYVMVYRQLSLQNSLQKHMLELTRANRSLDMLRTCNEILVRAQSEQQLLNEVCKTIVELGAFPFTWVGIIEGPNGSQIKPKACHGAITDAAELPPIPLSGEAALQEQTKTNLYAGQTWTVTSITRDDFFQDWHDRVDTAGFDAALLLPMMENGRPFGVLGIHSSSARQFDDETTRLLINLVGDIAFGISTLRAHTTQQTTEFALKREHDLFSRVMETNPAGVLVIDPQAQILYMNVRAREILNVPNEANLNLDELIKANQWSFTDENGLVLQNYELPHKLILSNEQSIYDFHVHLKTNGRSSPWIMFNGAPMLNSSGEMEAVVLTLEDITTTKEAGAALTQSERRYRQLFETVQEGIWSFDENNITTYVNETMAGMLGYPIEDIVGRSLLSFLDEENRKATIKQFEKLSQGGSEQYDCEFIHRDGHHVYAQLHASALHNEEGRYTGMLALAADVTARRMRERELEAIARMANALRETSSQQEIARAFLDQMIYIFRGKGAALAEREPSGEVHFVYGAGAWKNWIGSQNPSLLEVTASVMDSGRPLVSQNTTVDFNLAFPDLLGFLNTVICLPLVVHRQTIGAFWLGKPRLITTNPQTISQDEVKLLTAAADIGASALQRALLLEQTELRLRRMSALRDITLTISTSLNVHNTLDQLLKHVVSKLDVSAASVLLFNPEAKRLDFAAGQNLKPMPRVGASVMLKSDYASQAVQTGHVITASHQPEILQGFDRSWTRSLEGFQHYEAIPLIAKGQPKGVLELFYHSAPMVDAEWLDFLSSISTQVAITIDNAELFERLHISNQDLMLAYDATIEGWSHAMELRDREMEGHAERVAEITLLLAKKVGIAQEQLVHIRRGALLHDIGKMAISDNVLYKVGSFTPHEWEIMRRHPEYAYQLLYPIVYLRPAIDIPYCHHERWDGKGYPRGLKGEAIPLAARIFTIVDVWDALRSDRPYRKGWSAEKVSEYIRLGSGTMFDPSIVKVFLEQVLPEM
ncbi:MAG TPA: HD domain-containing phosphohydrolase [Longilinea sp.]|nr:HD domain-containing phosphohydrolase [Longilinea sp.]